MRDKIFSSDFCVPDKLGPLRALILPFQHATCVRRAAHEYFVLGSQRFVIIGCFHYAKLTGQSRWGYLRKMDCQGASHYAQVTGQRSVGILEEKGNR